VLPFSTGVILEPLPVQKDRRRLPAAVANLKQDNWFNAAEAIMTTDTQPKAASRTTTIGGHSRHDDRHQQGRRHDQAEHGDHAGLPGLRRQGRPAGAGRTGALRGRPLVQLHHHRRRHLDQRLLHPDGHRRRANWTSTDRQRRTTPPCATPSPTSRATWRSRSSATAKAPPSSSPSRWSRAATMEECRKIAYSIAHSPLVKTAFFASDPNLGRILAAIGYAGVDDLDVSSSTCTWTTCWWPRTAAAIRTTRKPTASA
jgi:glutamate N-acetyltransferase/amino-acid N-acetyltransferase